METPPLNDPQLAIKGAGAYETNCRVCHGSPAQPSPRVAQRMTPPPPYLPDVLSLWEDRELYYIVRHGIKLTGMPAWPSQGRDDEVWAMVAFLRTLPNLSAEQYRGLAAGETGCGRCHGRGDGAFPKLAGQSAGYIARSLEAYARSERHSGIMEPIAADLTAGNIQEFAEFYSSLPKSVVSAAPSPETAAAILRGESIAQEGIPNQQVPACAACHGPTAEPRDPVYLDHAGQHADYLVLQLELFKNRQRGGTAYAHLMHRVADGLNAGQMRDVALYYSYLGPNARTR